MQALLNSPLGQTLLGGKVVTIGRIPTNQIVIPNDTQVSGRHVEIHPGAQGYTLIDLGSINGTFVNGQRLTPNVPYVLKVGDTIRIGQMTFFFEVRGAYQMPSLGQPPQPQQQPQQQSSTQHLSPQGGSQTLFQQPQPFSPPQQQILLGLSLPIIIGLLFLGIGLVLGAIFGITFFIWTSCVHYPFLLLNPNTYVACRIGY